MKDDPTQQFARLVQEKLNHRAEFRSSRQEFASFQDNGATFGRVYDADEIRDMFTAVATSAIPPLSLKGL